jgi:adenosylcobinamide-phosphate synthase
VAEPIALAALALDAAIGWPPRLYARVGHPVGAFAWVLDALERRWNRGGATRRRALGIATMAILLAGTVGVAILADQVAGATLGDLAWIAAAILAWPALAQRSLHDHVRPVAAVLASGDLPAARTLVAAIVGRDTATLDETGVARAATESLAESFCDGVVAPLFWLLVAGLPGVWAYKAINTADSMIGHREPRWRAFGWAAARIDDGANLLPARLAGILICLAGGGWRTMIRDHARHASPNAGWPEAAMAGALDVALGGPVAYDGAVQDKPWIGAEGRVATGADLTRALAIYVRACALLWIVAGAVAWWR